MTNEYTLVLIHFNQPERLLNSLNAWNLQTIKPTQIIIVDDGSDKFPTIDPKKYTNVQVIKLPHTGNLGAIFNKGIQSVKTPFYCTAEPSLMPVGPYYMEKMLARSGKGIQAVPIYCTTDSQLSFNGQGYFEAYTHNFGHNLAYSEAEKRVLFAQWNIKEPVDEGRLAKGPWFPIDGFIKHIDDFLNYSESYRSWGCYDVDYLNRILLSDVKTYLYTDMAFMHLNHPKTGGIYQFGREIAFMEYCRQYYETHHITKIDNKLTQHLREKYEHRV